MARSIRSATEVGSRGLSLALSLMLALGPSVARADSPDDTQAKALFKKGMTAYDVGDFDGALKLYSDAYQLAPRPGFLFNIAQCHRQLNNFERAGFFYGRFIDTSKPNAPNVELATQLLAEMTKRQAEKVTEEKARAEDDARKQEQAAEAARQEEHRRDAPLVTALTPNVAEMPPPPPPPMAEEQPAYKRWWFWTLVGVGVAAVATGATVGVVASQPKARETTLLPIGGH